MRILVSGGAGFIGSHTVEALLRQGHAVRVFDNLSSGRVENLHPSAELTVGDVRDYAALVKAADGCDGMIHLAALVSVPQSIEAPLETLAVNTTGTANLLEAARAAGVRRFALASTCAVYGDLPGVKDEHAPLLPLVPYSASKLMAEEQARMYARCYGMETVSLRYFNVYGPRQRADSPYSGVIALWCASARAGRTCRVFGDGSQTRDFISVHDVAQANALAVSADTIEPGSCYNVATGQPTTLNMILNTLGDLLGPQVRWEYAPPRTGDILHSQGDSQQLQQLGWQPRVPLAQGLAELVLDATPPRQ